MIIRVEAVCIGTRYFSPKGCCFSLSDLPVRLWRINRKGKEKINLCDLSVSAVIKK